MPSICGPNVSCLVGGCSERLFATHSLHFCPHRLPLRSETLKIREILKRISEFLILNSYLFCIFAVRLDFQILI